MFVNISDLIEEIGSGFSKGVVGLAPSGHHPYLTHQWVVLGRQANGDHVVPVGH